MGNVETSFSMTLLCFFDNFVVKPLLTYCTILRECTNNQTDQDCFKKLSYPLKSFITDFFLLEKNNCILISSKIEKLARRDAERELVRWPTIY